LIGTQGLVKGYYDNRYFIYAQHKADALLHRRTDSGGLVGGAGFAFTKDEVASYIADVMKAACMFGHETGGTTPPPPPSSAVGDPVAIARELLAKYPPA
jgi:hypothetical protein